MIAAEPYLKTQRVAEAPGVSASTIKRWVDTGTIWAVRTSRKAPAHSGIGSLRLAREQGVHAAKLEILAGLSSRGRELTIGSATCSSGSCEKAGRTRRKL